VPLDPSHYRLAKNLARADYLKDVVSSAGSGGAGYESCGPPMWDRSAWEAFRNQYGRYPFGPQPEGGVIYPPTFAGAPPFVYELMGLRQPPVTVDPYAA
jgi:hypothetical protein